MFHLDKGPCLLLGEGDFSFSTAIQPLMKTDIDIVSTSFLNEKEVRELHKNAAQNIEYLIEKGVKVHHGVDATRLHHSSVKDTTFERIIFNFPHIGGKSNIKKNRELLQDFFPSAVQLLSASGDICITLAQGQGGTPADTKPRLWHDSWQVVGAAAYCDLVLAEVFPFTIDDFPAYNSVGFRSQDRNFYTKGGLTYKFKRSCKVMRPENCALDVSPVSHFVDKESVVIDRYIAAKLKRNLLDIPEHPLNHTYNHFHNDFMGKRSAFEFTPENYTDISNELLLLNKTANNTQQAYVATKKQGAKVGYFRTSLFDSVSSLNRKKEFFKENKFYLARGQVFKKIGVDNKDLPVQHELCVIAKEQDNVSMEKFRTEIESTLQFVMMNCNVTLKDNSDSDLCDYKGFFSSSNAIEVTWKSQNHYYQNSCNQVEAKGPPQLKKNVAKESEHNQIIGYIGFLDLHEHESSVVEHESKKIKVDSTASSFISCVLNLDFMAQIRHDIPDMRLLWSSNSNFLDQFKSRHPSELTRFKPISLYPPLWRHDLSFWENENEEFDEQKLCDIIRNVTGDMLVSVILTNVWPEPGTGKISRCYREVYQSGDVAISHARAHAFQNAVRLTVAKELGVELR